MEWTHVRWETLIRWRTTSNIETPEQSRSLQQKNENGIPRRCSISILGEQVCLSCDRRLFRRPHTLDIGDKLQRRISRLKSLLSHFRFLRLFENWTVENFLEGGGMQKVLNLKISD